MSQIKFERAKRKKNRKVWLICQVCRYPYKSPRADSTTCSDKCRQRKRRKGLLPVPRKKTCRAKGPKG